MVGEWAALRARCAGHPHPDDAGAVFACQARALLTAPAMEGQH